MFREPSTKIAAALAWLERVTGNPWIHWIGGILIGAAFGMSLSEWLRRRENEEEVRPLVPHNPTIVGTDELIPLPDAARLLYENARENNELVARAAERLSGSKNGEIASGEPDDILDWMAQYAKGKAAIYGSRPPSAKIELIPDKDGRFESGALIYKTTSHTYTSLAIAKRDVLRIMEW